MPEISEKELEDFLFKLSKNNKCLEYDELYVGGRCLRQIDLGAYGIIDLLFIEVDAVNKSLDITIVELKKGDIDLKSIGQISRYITGFNRFFTTELKEEKRFRRFSLNIEGILIGKQYSSDDSKFIIDNSKHLSSYLYKLKLEDGLRVKQSFGWQKTDENFKKINAMFNNLKEEHLKFIAGIAKIHLEK